MIYILFGNDTKKKNLYLKKLCKNNQPIMVASLSVTKEMIFDLASSESLFGDEQIVVFDNLIKEGNIDLSTEDISILSDSSTTFVFMEDKLLAADSKKYKKYAIIEKFDEPVKKQAPKINVFSIADSFARKDKIGTWVSYRDAISHGAQPEEISGILFWKIKTMMLSGTKFFRTDELKKDSSELVSLYHKSHRGDCDFTIGLEQFILSTLSKK